MYDPVGNITWQADDALVAVYYSGTVAAASNKYTYDALCRLIKCEGREHAGVTGAVGDTDGIRMGNVPLPTDGSAMRPYIQYYTYDPVGNMTRMKHTTTDSADNWTRDFDTSATSNRLAGWQYASSTTPDETYTHDARGNITAGFNHLYDLAYKAMNRLEVLVDAAGVTTYYQYDSGGQRVRKVTEASSFLRRERRYIAAIETCWELNPITSVLSNERWTVSVMDGATRVAVIDTSVTDAILRYQFTNHLGSASLELDEDADVINYEEYYPYGNTSY